MDAILRKIKSAKYISTLVISSAYHQIPLTPESKELTAFTVPGLGLFQFTRMPYGLSQASATFQRLVDKVISPELEPYAFSYLDDIIIVTETYKEHLRWLEHVLERNREAGLQSTGRRVYSARLKSNTTAYSSIETDSSDSRPHYSSALESGRGPIILLSRGRDGRSGGRRRRGIETRRDTRASSRSVAAITRRSDRRAPRTRENVRASGQIILLYHSVRKYVKQCQVCQQTKAEQRPPAGLMG